jgi:hypothetical protein
VPRNVASLIGALLLPTPVADVYLAARDGHWTSLWLLASVAAALVVLGLLAAALVRADSTRARLTIVMLLASCFPVVLTAHVGELHARSLLFWFALLVALAVEEFQRDRSVRVLAMSYAVVLYLALMSNLMAMRASSERSLQLVELITRALPDLSSSARIAVRSTDEPVPPRDYSFIRVTSIAALAGGGRALELALRRPVVYDAESQSTADVTVELTSSTFEVRGRD